MDTLAVTRSLDRIVMVGGRWCRLYAEDWISNYQAEEAASACAVVVNRANAEGATDFKFNVDLPTLGEMLSTLARVKLGVDDDRPYGFGIVVEPCDNVSHSS